MSYKISGKNKMGFLNYCVFNVYWNIKLTMDESETAFTQVGKVLPSSAQYLNGLNLSSWKNISWIFSFKMEFAVEMTSQNCVRVIDDCLQQVQG